MPIQPITAEKVKKTSSGKQRKRWRNSQRTSIRRKLLDHLWKHSPAQYWGKPQTDVFVSKTCCLPEAGWHVFDLENAWSLSHEAICLFQQKWGAQNRLSSPLKSPQNMCQSQQKCLDQTFNSVSGQQNWKNAAYKQLPLLKLAKLFDFSFFWYECWAGDIFNKSWVLGQALAQSRICRMHMYVDQRLASSGPFNSCVHKRKNSPANKIRWQKKGWTPKLWKTSPDYIDACRLLGQRTWQERLKVDEVRVL